MANIILTAPATDAAREWQGWGTALKPAYEPIIMARKPLIGTVAANVLQHGTGAINIDGCRVATDERPSGGTASRNPTWSASGMTAEGADTRSATPESGRWPANVLHDGSDEVVAAFPESGNAGERRTEKPGEQPFKTERGWNQHSMTRDGRTAPESYGDRLPPVSSTPPRLTQTTGSAQSIQLLNRST